MAYARRNRRPERGARRLPAIRSRILAGLLALLVLDVVAAGVSLMTFRHTAEREKALAATHEYTRLAALVPTLAFEASLLKITLEPAWLLTPIPGLGPRIASTLELVDALQAGTAGATVLEPSLAPFANALSPTDRHASGQALLARVAPAIRPGLTRLGAALPDLDAMVGDLGRVKWGELPGPLRALVHHPGQSTGTLRQAVTAMAEIHRASAAIPALLGLGHPAQYLLLLQNSGELRATGGFLTAYGYIRMANAIPGHLSAHNIYALDPENGPDRARYQPPEPPELRLYLPWPAWHLRDSNVSPDVPTFARTFYRFYDSIPGTRPVDGLVLIDTWFVDRLLQAVGPTTVSVNGEAVTLTAANANVTMEYLAEKSGLPQSTRKAFLSLVMKTVWHRALKARGQTLRQVLKAALWGLNHEHVLLYLNDPAAERALIAAGWAGAMPRHVSGDFLEVVDENLNGHKDNFDLIESIATTLRMHQGRLLETTRVTWVDPAVANGWMYVDYRAWVRLFVPLHATLLALHGDHGLHFVSQDFALRKTVLNAHVFILARTSSRVPPTHHTLTLVYAFPKGVRPGSLTLVKQPGVRTETVTVSAGRFRVQVRLSHTCTITLPPGY